MTKLPITVLCNTRFPSTAAHSLYLARLCESFAEQGYDVELVVPKRFKEVVESPLLYYSIKTPFRIRKMWSFDFTIFGPVLRRVAYPLQYFNFYVFVLCFFLFRSRKRVVYAMDNVSPLLSFLGYRVIFETHIGIGRYRRYFLALLKRAKKYVVVNSLIKDDFVKAGFNAEDILVAPNGVDLSLFVMTESKETVREQFSIPRHAKIIAYIGKYKTMGQAKGVEELIVVFAELSKERADVYLLIVGLDSGEDREIASLLTTYAVPVDRFKLVLHVPQREAILYMNIADVLVMNYPNTPYYARYMSPMKMFEYMATGNPIVTSDLPSVREVLHEGNAVIVRPDDRASLKEGILRALYDTVAIGGRVERARLDVAELTWAKRAKRILDFISH